MNDGKFGLALWPVMVAIILPFLLLFAYWHPIGTHGFDWLSNWQGKYDRVTFLAEQIDWYRTVMGRYTSTALLSTVSSWYSLTAARLVLGTVVLLTIPALAYLLAGLPKQRRPWFWALLFTCIWLSQLSNPYDSLYRISGLFTYHVGLLLSLLYAGALLRGRRWLATSIAVLAIGTNEISLVQCGMITAVWLIHNRRNLLQPSSVFLLLVTTGAAALELLAPGNFVRAELYTSGKPAFKLLSMIPAVSGYLWLGWVGSGMLILFTLFTWLTNDEPPLRLPPVLNRLLWIATLVIVPVSVAPVLLASQGDSLPEGITDWQILFVLLLIYVRVRTWPVLNVRPLLVPVVGLALLLPSLFGGLGIDRSRDTSSRSAASRIIISGPSGAAWLQLIGGSTADYDRQVQTHYALARSAADSVVLVPPLNISGPNFLYDESYDRRRRSTGERAFGYAVDRPEIVVKYLPAD